MNLEETAKKIAEAYRLLREARNELGIAQMKIPYNTRETPDGIRAEHELDLAKLRLEMAKNALFGIDGAEHNVKRAAYHIGRLTPND